MSWKVLITSRCLRESGEAAIHRLRDAGCEVALSPRFSPYAGDELSELLTDMDAIVADQDRFDQTVLSSPRTSRLKVISRWGVGYDAVDIDAATEQGVVVAFTPGLLNEAVADLAFGLLLAVSRRIPEGDAAMRAGGWDKQWGFDAHGKTLGIVGCGRIGQALARRASGFGMRLFGHDLAPSSEAEALGVRFVSLDELLAESDFVSLNAALTAETRGMIGADQLRRMKRNAFLINTARGALVDEPSLVRALNERWIAGAALDAYAAEPLSADHPLRKAPNAVLTPHQASYTRETGARVSDATVDAILTLMAGGRPPMVVNPKVFESPRLRAAIQS